jgi:hypothetical protein
MNTAEVAPCQVIEAISTCSTIVHARTSRLHASEGDLRGKKTKFRPGKKWLDIASVLEHDFTRD